MTMELLSQYTSNRSSESPDSSDKYSETAKVRSVYLLTYGRADLRIFPERKSFAGAVCEAVLNCEGPKAKIVQWSCCQESHKKGGGKHFHMAIKLNRIKRWMPIRDYLNKWSIHVHFSYRHVNYYTAWLYTTKEDRNYIQSPDHPDLANSGPPRTMSASQARKQRSVPAATSDHGDESSSAASEEERDGRENEIEEGRRASKAVKRKRSRRLSSFEVSKIIIDKGIRNRTELLALANVQKAEGKTDLTEFVFNRGNKVVEEVIATSWEMENASDVIERSKLTRLELLEKSLEEPCVDQCNGQWLQCANQILRWNDVSREAFSQAVKDLLEKGRGKFRNILFKVPANTGKTFLLNPLNVVCWSFSNPATSTFAWVGAEKAKVINIFLNDFR